MPNAVHSIVDGIQTLGEGAAKYWFLTVVLPLVAAGLCVVTVVVWLIRGYIKGREGRQREDQ